MREIKFRAWDLTNKEWYMYGSRFDLVFSGDYGDFFFDNDHPGNMRDVDLRWCQCTGLKDKYGEEIYEGDIITPVFPEDPNTYSSVIFEDGAFRKKYPKWDGSLPCPILNQYEVNLLNMAIAGNIYENPELLEEE